MGATARPRSPCNTDSDPLLWSAGCSGLNADACPCEFPRQLDGSEQLIKEFCQCSLAINRDLSFPQCPLDLKLAHLEMLMSNGRSVFSSLALQAIVLRSGLQSTSGWLVREAGRVVAVQARLSRVVQQKGWRQAVRASAGLPGSGERFPMPSALGDGPAGDSRVLRG